MTINYPSIRIAGEGGEGIISMGDLISRSCARMGMEVFTFKTFPAEVRGGYTMYQIRTGATLLHNSGDGFDILCAFDDHAYKENSSFMHQGTVLVHNDDFNPVALPEGVQSYAIPMGKIATSLHLKQAKNMAALGAVAQLFQLDTETVRQLLSEKFQAKGEGVMQANIMAFEQGIAVAKDLTNAHGFFPPHDMKYYHGVEKIMQARCLFHVKEDAWRWSPIPRQHDVVLLSGNEAIAIGALIAGINFFSAYPITPASSIAKYLAIHLPKTGGTVVQTEDEIAAISQAIGASYAGGKAMTATSGPGLSLMSEMLGMSFMAEIPVVIVDVQRGGPSTGLPTKHEQSDLFAAVHGSHGDAGRIVLAAGNVAECISVTIDAVNLSERFQCPVILLADSLLAFATQTVPYPYPDCFTVEQRKTWRGTGEYRRYSVTDDGVSPMAIPGEKDGFYISTGLEHDETGNPSYSPEIHEQMSHKRFSKLAMAPEYYPAIEVDGSDDSTLGIITWGSSIGVVREALTRLRAEGISIKGLYPRLLWPMPVEQYRAFAQSCGSIIVAEVNYQGQLAHFIRANTGIEPISYTICGGQPFTVDGIITFIREHM